MLTFAGRQDRMGLLTHYVREALRRGLIDEWHVWNFTRNDQDDRWLKSEFPIIGRTPDDMTYHRAGEIDTNAAGGWTARVRAKSDVHIGIRARDQAAPSYELVIGGWRNQTSILRRLDTAEFFVGHHDDRSDAAEPLAVARTPGILSAAVFRDIAMSVGTSGITFSVDGSTVLDHAAEVMPGGYDIHVKTGYGSEGEWRFPDRANTGEFRYQSDKRSHEGWSEFYNFYADRAEHYAETVFLKCDDDIVYIRLDALADFVGFRIREGRNFLVSANVINNGSCAHIQRGQGALPEGLIRIDPPEDPDGPFLWNSADMATDLHNYFLDNRASFEEADPDPVLWHGQFSINFVSWLGRDTSFMATDMTHDEYTLSTHIPEYLNRPNCIYPKLVVSHLTFYPQDDGFDHEVVLGRYRELADQRRAADPVPAIDSRTATPGDPLVRQFEELRDHVTATAQHLLWAINGHEQRHRRDLMFAADAAATSDSARLTVEEMATAQVFDHPHKTLEYALSLCPGDGMALEFGVSSGGTLRIIAAHHRGEVYGFDSFDGLPETWRTGYPAATFATEQRPQVDGAELVVGLFADVLPEFLADHPGPVDFVHIDCDLYSAAHTVLESVGPRLHAGSVIVFDEYFNYPGWRNHEYRAWQEYVAATGTEFVYEGYTGNHEQVAVRITRTR